MKYCVGMLVTLFLVIIAITGNSLAQDALIWKDYKYTVENGRAVITSYGGTETNLVLPQSLDVYPLASIGDYAFQGCGSLQGVTVPEGVESIGNGAFFGCANLAEISLPRSLMDMGTWVFSGCASLEAIRISDENPAYGQADGVLFSRTKNSLLIYPAGKQGESYEIPQGTLSVGVGAFDGSRYLTEISIPGSITSIGNIAFHLCNVLTSITVSMDNLAFASLDGVLFDKAMAVLLAYPAGRQDENYEVPQGVTSFGYSAFAGNGFLQYVTLPASITEIGGGTFSGCGSLKGVRMSSGVTCIGNGAFNWCSSLADMVIPDTVESIGSQAFSNCPNLAEVTIPDSVVSIGDKAFDGCQSLTLQVKAGSYAQQYAQENGIPWADR